MFLGTKRWYVRGWCCALTLTIGCAIPGPTFAQESGTDAPLASVFKDWQSRQGVLKSARYVLTGTTEFKDDKLPPGDPNRPRRFVLLLDLARKRYRLEGSANVIYANGKDDPKEWEYRRRISTSAYDGEALQSLTHRKANRIDDDVDDLSIGKGDLGPGAVFGSELWPIFFAHGIVPTVHSPLLVDKLPLTHDPDDFQVRGRQLLRDQHCLLVQTKPLSTGASPGGEGTLSDEFWINPTQKSAIHRYVLFSDSNPWSRLDIFWKNTAHGWWVDHWSETWSVGGHVRRIFRFRVESFEANPEVSDGDFTLPAEPGMKVTVSEGPPPGKGLDPFKATIKTYRISPSGAWKEIATKGKNFPTLDGKESPPEGRKRRITWTIVSGLAIGALLLYVLRQRRKKAAL